MFYKIPELLSFGAFKQEIILNCNTSVSLYWSSHPNKSSQQNLALERSPEGLKFRKEKKVYF